MHFEALNVLAFDDSGLPLEVDALSKVKIDFDNKSFVLKAKSGLIRLHFSDICGISIDDEVEKNDYKSTAGKMILTGLAASLYFQGRRGGLGASLGDLRVTGVDKKIEEGGIIVFYNGSVVRFRLDQRESSKFYGEFVEDLFAEDAIDAAQSVLAAVTAIAEDGRPAIEELTADFGKNIKHLRGLESEISKLNSFKERAELRKSIDKMKDDIRRHGHLIVGGMITMKMSVNDFLRDIRGSDLVVQELGLPFQKEPLSLSADKSALLLRLIGLKDCGAISDTEFEMIRDKIHNAVEDKVNLRNDRP